MHFFTSCWSAVPAHVHFLFIPAGSPSTQACCIWVVWRGLPPTSRTDHQPLLSLLNSLRSASWCLPEWWLAREEVACHGSSPAHIPRGPLREGLSHTIFPLSEKEHAHLWLISLLKEYSSAETSDCFSGVFGVLTKAVSVYSIRTEVCADEVSIAACTREMARAGSAMTSCYWTRCSVTPERAVRYIPGNVLQQNHQ